MNSSLRTLTSLLLLIILCHGTEKVRGEGLPQQFRLLPQPQKVKMRSGRGLSFGELKTLQVAGGLAKGPVLPAILGGLKIQSSKGSGTLLLTLSKSADVPTSREGYVMEIAGGKVSVRARADAGFFYACQTLGQLLEDARDQHIPIPACKITDYPDVDYRAIHLDLKHHVDSLKYYYQLMDRLAKVKVNAIIVEFEDKLKFREAPKVGSGNAISVEDFAKLSRYAQQRNIEISPLVQGLGHASFILKHEEYKGLRDNPESDWSFDPLNPKTYELQFSLYRDAITATPNGKYLHIGGDEVGNLGYSELAKKSGKKPIELQMYWLRKVCEFAEQNHRIPIFWDDMVFKLSGLYQTTYDPRMPVQRVDSIWKANEHLLNENMDLFPKNCVYMRWNYDDPDLPGNRKAIEWYKSHQLKVMAATAGQTMWSMMPRQQSNFKSIKEFSKITAEEKLDGILCTFWDDCSPHFETYMRGVHDFAFLNWNYEDLKPEELHSIFRQRFYGPAVRDTSFESEDLLEKSLPFWETALINKGHRSNYPADIHLISLPDPNKQGAWSEKYQEKIARAKSEINRHAQIQEKIEKALKVSVRNQYSLRLLAQINELQVYPARLIIALDAYDRATPGEAKKIASEGLQKQLAAFADVRERFEKVFGETRILSNPANYIMDQNQHHHLANGTKNSDWMYVYELAMIARIRDTMLLSSR